MEQVDVSLDLEDLLDDDRDLQQPDEAVEVEPQVFGGDFFGCDYGPDNFPGWDIEDVDEDEEGGSDELDGDGNEPSEGPDEHHWEAPPPAVHVEDDAMDADDDEVIKHPDITRGREEVERSLRQGIYVEPFPRATAGAPADEQSLPDRGQDPGGLAPENPYAPFASRIDWEIARWAKLRGPGSTVVTELLSIPGFQDALSLSYKNSRELNHIIDQQLPARRPRFQRMQTTIEGEVFDVYFRDIIACIRALFK